MCDKAFAVDSIYQYGAYQQGFTSVVKTFFEKKSKDFSSHTGTRFISENHQLASEIDSPITRKWRNIKVYLSRRDDNYCVDFAEMQLIANTIGSQILTMRYLCLQKLCMCCSIKNKKTLQWIFKKILWSQFFSFFLSGFPFTNIHESQDSRGRRRAFRYLLTTTSTRFTDT